MKIEMNFSMDTENSDMYVTKLWEFRSAENIFLKEKVDDCHIIFSPPKLLPDTSTFPIPQWLLNIVCDSEFHTK